MNSIQLNFFATCFKCSLGWIQSNWIFLQHVSSAHLGEFNPIEFSFATCFKCSLGWIQSNWIFFATCFKVLISMNSIKLSFFATRSFCNLTESFYNKTLHFIFSCQQHDSSAWWIQTEFFFGSNTTLLEFKYFLLSVLWSPSIYLDIYLWICFSKKFNHGFFLLYFSFRVSYIYIYIWVFLWMLIIILGCYYLGCSLLDLLALSTKGRILCLDSL